MLTAVVGVNWGDEGKGRMVDLLAEDYDLVVRYQGGNNAGHTVINHLGKFILNLLPSGVLRPEVVNVMGCGMVIDLEHLCGELERLRAGGVTLTPDRLKISDRAVVCLPYNRRQDILEEERLASKQFGSTRRGIGPVYGDKYMKKAVRMGELLHPEALRERVRDLTEWKNITFSGYHVEKLDPEQIFDWLMTYGEPLKGFVCDTGTYLDLAAGCGKNILFEAQLGALRDIDFGIYPYTSSSNTIAAYAPIGAGIPNRKIDRSVGVMKAYSTCVGAGPFTCEMEGAEADALRGAGGEFGAATGRPRRVGPFDVVASRYGARMQGADELALTKLDVLSYLDKIPVCTAYQIGAETTGEFPLGERLSAARPVLQTLEGWHCDISGCRSMADLPRQAVEYIDFLEDAVGRPIRSISVGPDRDQCIFR